MIVLRVFIVETVKQLLRHSLRRVFAGKERRGVDQIVVFTLHPAPDGLEPVQPFKADFPQAVIVLYLIDGKAVPLMGEKRLLPFLLVVLPVLYQRVKGRLSCHYCDSFGFQQITGFLDANPLKNAEMALEDDYGMIDGIINNGPKEPTVAQLEQQAMSGQTISLMDLAAAVHREKEDKRKSVVEQLHQQPKQESKKTAPKKSAEREL